MHSWLIRDTPPKPQAPVSRLAANNVNHMQSMSSLERDAGQEADPPSRLPRRLASRALLAFLHLSILS